MSDLASPTELLRGLAVLAEPPAPEHAGVARALGLSSLPTPSQYSDIFLFQLYPYASVHLGAEGMMGGEAHDRVAGFWRALGHAVPEEPDHLASLLGLYVALTDRVGESASAEAALVLQSRRALLDEHVAPWIFPFLARVEELGEGLYSDWAQMLSEVMRAEVVPATDLPLHLRLAPELPDPRAEGAALFLSGLLAPVRSGVVLTRADLALLSGELDLGLRAGERRYALEHLLAQAPEAVLNALAAVSRGQAAAHADRQAWLGVTARFFADRAFATTALLESLAGDDYELLDSTREAVASS